MSSISVYWALTGLPVEGNPFAFVGDDSGKRQTVLLALRQRLAEQAGTEAAAIALIAGTEVINDEADLGCASIIELSAVIRICFEVKVNLAVCYRGVIALIRLASERFPMHYGLTDVLRHYGLTKGLGL
ncbi:unnamed protein product, partial [Polarella glacialis]